MRIVVLIVFLVLLGLLAALNTNFLMYPHTLNLGFATYTGLPLGLLLLAVMFVPVLVFYFWVGVAKLRAEADLARLLRDMEALRVSLDTQEGSRFAQLQSHLDQRLGVLGNGTSGNAELEAVNARIDTLSRDLNLQLAQIDDYLKRKLG